VAGHYDGALPTKFKFSAATVMDMSAANPRMSSSRRLRTVSYSCRLSTSRLRAALFACRVVRVPRRKHPRPLHLPTTPGKRHHTYAHAGRNPAVPQMPEHRRNQHRFQQQRCQPEIESILKAPRRRRRAVQNINHYNRFPPRMKTMPGLGVLWASVTYAQELPRHPRPHLRAVTTASQASRAD
jgi:hypothetical protein